MDGARAAMIDFETAAETALRRAAELFPGQEITLAPLRDATRGQEHWLFRCSARGGGAPIICKIGAPTVGGRARLARQAERLRWATETIRDPACKTPRLIAHDPQGNALVMEDAGGMSLHLRLMALPDVGAAHPLLGAAARWLAGFHRPTATVAAFAPRPHLATIYRRLDSVEAEALPERAAFMAALSRLEALAPVARGKPVLRCVTHRDFHPRNLVMSDEGSVYGIDFENEKQDEALRDLLFFLLDFSVRWFEKPSGRADLQRAARVFVDAYGDGHTASEVTEFFQLFMVLNSWSRLDARRLDKPVRRHKLQILMGFAEEPLLGPLG